MQDIACPAGTSLPRGKKSMKKRLFITVLIMMAFLIPCGANGEGLDTLKPVMLATSTWIPYTDAQKKGHGFFTQILTQVFSEMGLTPQYSFYPWKRCESYTAAGKIWATFPYTPTHERAKTFVFSDSISNSTSKFFYYGPNKGYQYHALDDLRKYKIGGISGYFYTEEFKHEKIDVTYAPDEISGFKMLQQGRVQLLVINNMVGWDIIRTHFRSEADNFHTLDKPLSDNPLKLMVSRSYPQSDLLLKKFNAALKKVKDSGQIKAILARNGLKN